MSVANCRCIGPLLDSERANIDDCAFKVKLANPMLHLLHAVLATARSSLRLQRELALEHLALRQRLAVLRRKTKRPKLTKADRAFWITLSRLLIRLAERSDPREARQRDRPAS